MGGGHQMPLAVNKVKKAVMNGVKIDVESKSLSFWNRTSSIWHQLCSGGVILKLRGGAPRGAQPAHLGPGNLALTVPDFVRLAN